MYLDATTRSLQILLGGAITTNQLPVVCSWTDTTTTTVTPGTTRSISNNTTAVTVVAAPAASTQRQVQTINVYNNDTVAATVTVRLNDNGTFAILAKATLQAGESLTYEAKEGWQVLNNSKALPTGGTANQVLVKQSATNYDVAFANVQTDNLANNSVTLAKMASIANHTVLGTGWSDPPSSMPPDVIDTISGSVEIDSTQLRLIGDVSNPSNRSVYAVDPDTSTRGWVVFEKLNDLQKTEIFGTSPIQISSAGFVSIFSATGIDIALNDQFVFEAFILLSNNSGVARTYSYQISLDDGTVTFSVEHADGTTVATSAVNDTALYVKGMITLQNASPDLMTGALITDHGLGSAGSTGVNAVLASSRKSWNSEAKTMSTASGNFVFSIATSSGGSVFESCNIVGASLRRCRSY